MLITWKRVFAAASLGAAGSAFAVTGLPPIQHSGDVRYVSGGVGQDESHAFVSSRSEYPLSIEIYAKQNGHDVYTSDAAVTVRDDRGDTVVQTRAQGPFVLVDAPPGRDSIDVTRSGRTETRHAQLQTGRTDRAIFVFDSTSS